jgi:hypothetical protein
MLKGCCKATKAEKSQILDHGEITGWHRDHAWKAVRHAMVAGPAHGVAGSVIRRAPPGRALVEFARSCRRFLRPRHIPQRGATMAWFVGLRSGK